jgi:hypothetical protein
MPAERTFVRFAWQDLLAIARKLHLEPVFSKHRLVEDMLGYSGQGDSISR